MTEATNKTQLEFSVQNNTKAGLQEIKNDVRGIAETAVQAGQRAASAFDGMGKSGEEAAVKLTRSESAIAVALRRSIEQMELAQRQAAGMADAFDFKIGFRGIDTSKLQPAIDHLRQLEAQISVTKAAEAEFAAQNAFAQKHAQAAALAKSAEYTSWWATELDKAKAAEAELAAQNAFAIKHQQATELAKASQYASWWAAELDKVEAAERKLASETAFLSSLKAQTDAIGKTRADLLEMQAAQMGISSQAAPFIAKLRETEQGLGKMGQSAGQTRMALQQLPLQFQDIVVSLQAGQQPFTVFLQQGSQIAGSFGGANAALKAMANYVWGLVNPYTVAAAAVVALGVAMAQAESSLRTHQTLMNQLEATGRAGYLNSDAVKQLKADMAELPGISKSMATAIIADLVQVRTLGGEALEKIALLSADFAAATGQDAAGAAKELAKAMEDPAKGARALDEAFNFLTSSQLLMVDAMVEAGDKAGAQELALEALQKRLEGVAKKGLTPLQEATNDFAKAWAEAMKDLGHGGPLQVANELMAGLVIHTADAVRWLAQLKPPAWLEEAAKGGLNGWVYRAITGDAKLPKQSTGGASGSWGPNTGGASGSWGTPNTPELSDLEKEVKLALEAAKGYEAKGAAVEKVRSDIARFSATLQKLRDDGKGDGPAAKELEKRIEGAQEKLKSLTKTTQSHSKELENQNRLIGQLSGLSSTFYKDWDKLNKMYAQGRISLQALEQAQADLLAKQPFAVELAKEEAEVLKSRIKAYEDEAKAKEKLLKQQQDAATKAEEAVQKALEEEHAYALAASAGITLAEAVAQIAVARAEDAYQQALNREADAETLLALHREIEARKQLVEVMQQRGVREANEKVQDKITKDWEKTSQMIGDTLSDYIMGGGKDAATYLKRLFSTLVLQPVVKYGVQQAMGAVGLGPQQQGMQGGQGGMGNMGWAVNMSNLAEMGGWGLSAANTAGTAYANATNTGIDGLLATNGAYGTAASSTMSTIGTGLSYAGALYSASQGQWGSAVGTAVGTYFFGPIGGAVGGAIGGMVDGMFGGAGTPHGGAAAGYSGGQITDFGKGYTKHQINSEYASGMQAGVSAVAATVGQSFDALAALFDRQAGYRVTTAFSADDDDPAWGRLQIYDAVGEALVDWNAGRYGPKDTRLKSQFSSDPEKAFDQYLQSVAASSLPALKDIAPAWADAMIDGVTKAIGFDGSSWKSITVSGQEAVSAMQSVVQQIALTEAGFESLGNAMGMFSSLSDDMKTALLSGFGDMGNLTSVASGFYQSFYSEQERYEASLKQMRDMLASLEIGIDPAMGEQAKADFKAAVLGAFETGNGELSTQLLAINQQFAVLADYAQKAAVEIEGVSEALSEVMLDLLDERKNLEAELLRAQGDQTGYLAAVRAIATEGYTDAERAAWDYNAALQSQIDALDAAAEAAKEAAAAEQQRLAAIASERAGLERQLLQLQGNTAALRAIERAALDESNRALYDRIAALQDEQAAAAAFGTSMSSLSESRFSLEQQLRELQGRSGEAAALQRARDLDKLLTGITDIDMQEQVVAAYDFNRALEDQISSWEQLGSAMQRALDSVLDSYNRNLNDMASIVKGVKDWTEELQWGDLSGLSDEDKHTSLSYRYADTQARAAAGDKTAMSELQEIAAQLAKLEQERAASMSDYSIWAGRLATSLTSTADTGHQAYIDEETRRARAWAEIIASMYSAVPKLDVGTNYVQKSGLAMIHEGEAVVPKAFNPWANGGGSQQSSNAELIAELRALRTEVAELRANTAKLPQMADNIENVTAGGNAMAVEVI